MRFGIVLVAGVGCHFFPVCISVSTFTVVFSQRCVCFCVYCVEFFICMRDMSAFVSVCVAGNCLIAS